MAHLRTSAPAKSACAICWAKIIRAPVPSVEKTLYYTLTLKKKFHWNLFQRYWWVKSVYIFLGHSVFKGRTLPEAVGRRPDTTEARLWSQAICLYDMWWKIWHSFFSESFGFPLSVALHQYSVLSYHNDTWAKSWNLETQQCSSRA